jgi:lysylphosphatidylglycerol synthetase-like protein (DUF2156 family)
MDINNFLTTVSMAIGLHGEYTSDIKIFLIFTGLIIIFGGGWALLKHGIREYDYNILQDMLFLIGTFVAIFVIVWLGSIFFPKALTPHEMQVVFGTIIVSVLGYRYYKIYKETSFLYSSIAFIYIIFFSLVIFAIIVLLSMGRDRDRDRDYWY